MNRTLLTVLLIAVPFGANAQLCMDVDGTRATNNCGSCMEVTLRELRSPSDRGAGLFSGQSRTLRLEAGQSSVLTGTGKWSLGHLAACR